MTDEMMDELWHKAQATNIQGDMVTKFARAIEAHVRSESIPIGWKIVPIEPTIEMLRAGKLPQEKYANNAYHCYARMIDAAPLPGDKS